MAYKDEYEIARLFADGSFHRQLSEQFEGDFSVSYNLAPPILASRDPATGHLRKREFGPWVRPLLGLLRHLKVLRGTPFDLFGQSVERRTERLLIREYRQAVDAAIAVMTPENHEIVLKISGIPDKIRGFGHVKDRSILSARASLAELQAKLASANCNTEAQG
jgi:indolepyruvate ferredoxin oxidoreductase